MDAIDLRGYDQFWWKKNKNATGDSTNKKKKRKSLSPEELAARNERRKRTFGDIKSVVKDSTDIAGSLGNAIHSFKGNNNVQAPNPYDYQVNLGRDNGSLNDDGNPDDKEENTALYWGIGAAVLG